ncbi:MAG: RDD family protein [Actinomycetota bacterium]|nr:RDD family protein [Actinomycetota bacterium]
MQPGGPGRNPGGLEPTPTAAPGREPLITPEAVILELRTASLGSRSLAKLLDLLIIAAGVGIILSIAALAGVGETPLVVLVSVLSVLALFGYPALWESLWRGRTPGKAMLGLRVATDEGSPIGPRHAIIRAVLSPVDLVLGAESILLSTRDRRLGDLVAGTVVLQDRTVDTVGPPLWFSPPPGWEVYAESLDTSTMTGNEQAVIRSFLLRWREFDGSARLRLAAGLAAPLVPRLGLAPPPWLPPDLYLLCVAAARQRGDHGGVPQAMMPTGWGHPAGVAPAPVAATAPVSHPRDPQGPPGSWITPPA